MKVRSSLGSLRVLMNEHQHEKKFMKVRIATMIITTTHREKKKKKKKNYNHKVPKLRWLDLSF
jgi:hypothetical protein